MQEDIIQAILQGEDVLALLPTGGGKSICFQVPALAQEGVCVVVSPLIALMKDQVQNLQKRNIKAEALYSGMSKKNIDRILDNCVYGDIKFLYLSPERLQTSIFIERFKQMNVSFIAVDEAHCISQWGYDFRPAYLHIAELRNLKPKTPIMALTATATPEVVTDIQEKLLFEKQNVLQKSFLRKNISYSVLYENAKQSKLIDILHKVKGCAIVYAQNRRQTKEIADFLNKRGISALYYNAGLSTEERDLRQSLWIQNKKRVMVATNAFGMGIDKPDVRVVIHITLPDSLEAYFQEAGRAGRDEKKGYAVLLFNETDKLKKEQILQNTMPSIQEIKRVYEKLFLHYQIATGAGKDTKHTFDIGDFCAKNKLGVLKTYNALQFLAKDEYLSLSEELNQQAKVIVKCTQKTLHQFLENNAKYKNLLLTMLRSYGGMFDHFTPIKEKFLAQKIQINLQEVKQQLQQLQKLNILIYEEQSKLPYIYFLEDRLEINNLLLNTKYYHQRLKVFESKHKSMLGYAEKKDICRSQQLLTYFGETESKPCGICDVCLGRNKEKIADSDFKKIKNIVKSILLKESISLKDLEQKSKIKQTDKLLYTIQYLMQNDYIEKQKDQKLKWKKRN